MIHTSSGRRRPGFTAGAVTSVAVDAAAQAGLVAAAWFLVVRLQDGPVFVERALSVLTFAGGVAASILLLVAAWMSRNRSARRVAAAVAVYTGVALLLRAVQADPEAGVWMLLASVGILAVVGLLVLAVRGPSGAHHDRRALFVVVGLVAVCGVAVVVPGPVPPLVISIADLVAWSGVGAGGLLLVLVGLPRDRPLLRRTGLAFTTIGVAHAIRLVDVPASAVVVGAFELAAVAMFLVAALPFLLVSIVQSLLLFLSGKLMFGMSWGNHPAMLIPVILTTSIAATGLGLLVATFVRTESQVSSYATFLVVVLAGISGCYMPRDWLPEIMKNISLATPHAWALIGYQELLTREQPNLMLVAKCCGMLAAMGGACFAVGCVRFRRYEYPL